MTKPHREWITPRFLISFALATGLLGAGVGLVHADDGSENSEPTRPAVASNSRAWLISTRCVPMRCPDDVGPERFSYQVSQDDCSNWEPADADGFFSQAASDGPVVVFIHGNRTDRCDAIRDGWPVYQRLLCLSGGRPFRFVIWSWPADQICGGPRKDALVKAARSDAQSFYLAAWLERLPSEIPVTLIGYSFGARVIGGALHLAEGGTLLGRKQESAMPSPTRRPLRVMLVAAALDSEWLLPGNRNGLAGRQVEQMMATRNCCDRVLRFYPRMRRNDSSSALGFAGPASPGRLTESGLAFETVPVESQVGREHLWHRYLGSNAIRSRLAWYSFLVDESPSAPN
jgi:pimeloyl-ACP methyl ester carboxylesterase